jgi:hypothetical protein
VIRRGADGLPRWLALTWVVLAMAIAGAAPGRSSALGRSLTPEALTRAQAIRAEVTARYRQQPGRTLVVTEATGTQGSLLFLWERDGLAGRVVPLADGVYFSICSAHANCPYPARRAAWRLAAVMPHRQALELALRTLLETTANLVVVSLPTATPVWAVFERHDLLPTIDAGALLDRLGSSPTVTVPLLRAVVERLTRPRLFAPVGVGPNDTITAMRVFGS